MMTFVYILSLAARPTQLYKGSHLWYPASQRKRIHALRMPSARGRSMDNQPHQRFCTNCGQPLAPGSAFCVTCGTPVSASPASAPGQFPAGSQPGYLPPYAQAPAQGQDDPLLAGLAAGYIASQLGPDSLPQVRQRPRRRRSTLRGCGCLLLILALLAGPFIGLALTTGRLHLIFGYVAGAMVVVFLLLLLVGMLATRRGREALSEGLADGCLDAIFGGLLGG